MKYFAPSNSIYLASSLGGGHTVWKFDLPTSSRQFAFNELSTDAVTTQGFNVNTKQNLLLYVPPSGNEIYSYDIVSQKTATTNRYL
jgi:hypothetical protein